MIHQLWACERKYLEHYLNTISRIEDEDVKGFLSFTETKDDEDKIYAIDGDLMTININGVLSPTGPPSWAKFFGFVGTAYNDILKALRTAAEDDNIKRITLSIDSPGGMVTGVDEVWQRVNALSRVKSVKAEGKGLVASAAYWIASATSEITASSPVDIFGSIGVLVATYDVSKRMENAGIKRIIIRSSNAPNKGRELSTERGQEIMQDELDAIERNFIKRVADGRGVSINDVIENFGQGGVLVASDPDKDKPDALSARMIDGVTIDSLPTFNIGPEGVKFNDQSMGATKQIAVVMPRVTYPAPPSNEDSAKLKEALDELVDKFEKENNASQNTEEEETSPTYPASGYAQTKEGPMSILAKLLQENPELQAEIDKIETSAFERGKATTNDAVTAASVFLVSDDYPKPIKELAKKVVIGEASLDALNAAVAAYDSVKEEKRTVEAEKETSDPVVGSGEEIVSEDGLINSEQSYQASIAEARSRRGY
jgi:ClpP class serine protease